MDSEYLWIGIGLVIAVVIFLVLKSGKTITDTANFTGANSSSGNTFSDTAAPTETDIELALRSGQKITAIKYYRKIHGVGLKEAKEAVEAMDTGQ